MLPKGMSGVSRCLKSFVNRPWTVSERRRGRCGFRQKPRDSLALFVKKEGFLGHSLIRSREG